MTGDEAQWTMGRRKSRGEAPSRPFSPSRLPLRANIHRELKRRLGRRQHTYVSVTCHVFKVEFAVQSKQLPGCFFFTTSSITGEKTFDLIVLIAAINSASL